LNRTWDDIETHYLHLTEIGWKHDRFIELIKHIKRSGLTKRLFATTSLDKLVISIYKEIDFHREALHISFDRDKLLWHFDYYAVPNKPPEFTRTYTAEKGIEKLDNFIKMVRW